MGIHLYRIDDRLIHGQVVVGWGQPLNIRLLVLVDDMVAASDWEKELYRMAVPPEMEVVFADVPTAIRDHQKYASDARPALILSGDIASMYGLVKGVKAIGSVNLGGIHHRAGRSEKLRYIYLTPDEEQQLRDLEAAGVEVTAQDVPSARPVPLAEVLEGATT
ncbi:MAG TPA: PTS sugar transporter subunit IIB [Gemmatimonadaceae bacterium]|jgi:PTS system mannose-specific IIB component/fructoselysine and glucoselysine-specific PTS system IIB component|nr:PTS sugar transporter subunit IIB [Gemmatimonadaceae bacterium]